MYGYDSSPAAVADCLRQAAQLIRVRGWMRWKAQGSNGSLCAATALLFTSASDLVITDAITALATHLRHDGYGRIFRVDTITWWNDETADDAAEVVETLEKVAARIEELGLPETEETPWES